MILDLERYTQRDHHQQRDQQHFQRSWKHHPILLASTPEWANSPIWYPRRRD